MYADMLRQLQMLSDHSVTDSREGGVIAELFGTSHTLIGNDVRPLFFPRRKFSIEYAAAEVLWYLTLRGSQQLISPWAPQYPRWCDDGFMHGAVGNRLGCPVGSFKSLLAAAVSLLSARRTTRRCVMPLFVANDLIVSLGETKRNVPCYASMQYMIRDDTREFVAITNMRSNDVWLGVPYDVFAFRCLALFVMEALDIQDYQLVYVHCAGSLHTYAKYDERIRKGLADYDNEPLPFVPSPESTCRPRSLKVTTSTSPTLYIQDLSEAAETCLRHLTTPGSTPPEAVQKVASDAPYRIEESGLLNALVACSGATRGDSGAFLDDIEPSGLRYAAQRARKTLLGTSGAGTDSVETGGASC